jgi:Flp pilus assembly protein TadG
MARNSVGGDRSGEAGSAVVEFALVSVLLVALFLAVLQVGVALHVRNTLVAAAAEGARYGADADRSPADGAQRTRDVIASSLPASFAQDVTAGYADVGGLATVVVQVRAPLPLFGMAGPSSDLVVQGHALAEQLP